jgi:hypothetical protein
MPFFESIVYCLLGIKIGNVLFRKISYKLFLRQSIYKPSMKVGKFININIEFYEY